MSFDKICALFVFCHDFHCGQDSRLYRILSRIEKRYHPRITGAAFDHIRKGSECWQEANEIYQKLVERYEKGVR